MGIVIVEQSPQFLDSRATVDFAQDHGGEEARRASLPVRTVSDGSELGSESFAVMANCPCGLLADPDASPSRSVIGDSAKKRPNALLLDIF